MLIIRHQVVFIFSFFITSFTNASPYLPISQGEQIKHAYFTLSYNEETEQANWVYYELVPAMLVGDIKRSSNFRYDPLVSTKSASTRDYTHSGFDRGHLCPAGDMTFDSIAMYESFYMSNISPQDPGFNRGIWKELESKVRQWSSKGDSLIVVTGPVFRDNNHRIGKNKVWVPAYFYKALYSTTRNQMIAFVMPNEPSKLPIENYVVAIDSLEALTGFDFFSQLPDRIETKLESEIILAGWFGGPIAGSPSAKSNNKMAILFVLALIAMLIIILLLRKRR